MPEFQGAGLQALPISSPSDFNPQQAKKAVYQLLNCGVGNIAISHFGIFNSKQTEVISKQLLPYYDYYEEVLNAASDIFKSGAKDDEIQQFVMGKLMDRFRRDMTDLGLWNKQMEQEALFHLPINAAGVAYAAIQKAKGKV